MKKINIITALLLLASILMTSTLSAMAILPTYVERENGNYFLKVQGKPAPQGEPPAIGYVEVLYKNLQSGGVTVSIVITRSYNNVVTVYTNTQTFDDQFLWRVPADAGTDDIVSVDITNIDLIQIYVPPQ